MSFLDKTDPTVLLASVSGDKSGVLSVLIGVGTVTIKQLHSDKILISHVKFKCFACSNSLLFNSR